MVSAVLAALIPLPLLWRRRAPLLSLVLVGLAIAVPTLVVDRSIPFWGGPMRPIQAPTLIIWGQQDHYLGPDLAEPDHDDVPNLDRVERLPDASHWVHHDEAERVTRLLIDFSASAEPARNTQ